MEKLWTVGGDRGRVKLDLDHGYRFDWFAVNVGGLIAPSVQRLRNRGQECDGAVERLDAGDAALFVNDGLHGD